MERSLDTIFEVLALEMHDDEKEIRTIQVKSGISRDLYCGMEIYNTIIEGILGYVFFSCKKVEAIFAL
jgi:hypothetical protein